MTAPVGDDLTWLDELQRAHAAATPGPWEASVEFDGVWLRGDGDNWPAEVYGERREADAALIVAAVNAVPELIAELRKRDAALRAVESVCEELECDGEAAARGEAECSPELIDAARRVREAAALTPESVTT